MTGAIILARHGEPALSRKLRLSAAGYREWWGRYEVGGILPGQTAPPELIDIARKAGTIAASTRRRAIESAGMVAGGRPVLSLPVFIEAPLPPPNLPEWIRLSPRLWGFFTRVLWWFLDLHGGDESRAQAEARAELAADRLIALAADGDVLLLAHGFFNTMVARVMKARGWRYTLNQGWKYWTVKRFEPPSPEVGRDDG